MGTRHVRRRLGRRAGRGCRVYFALGFLLRGRLSRRELEDI